MCEKAILHLGGGCILQRIHENIEDKIIPCQVTSNVLGSTVYIEK